MKKSFYSNEPPKPRGKEVKEIEYLSPPSPLRDTRSTKKANPFYSSATWIKTRDQKRRTDPVCERCKKDGKLEPTRIIHHKRPLRYGGEQLDEDNLMSLCGEQCHSAEHKDIEEMRASGQVDW